MSTKSNVLGVLLAGRVMGGIGTSLLFSAPEAWLVGDAARTGVESSLGETFGLAYAGDSIVAILAGQMAGMAAGSRGPSGPFELSVGFLILGGLLASFMWKENVAGGANGGDEEKGGDDSGSSSSSKPTIRDAVKVVKEDPKIMLVGSIQSLFEAAMYVFVLNWPPAVSKAVSAYFSKFAADSSAAISTPYGTVFSCFSKFVRCACSCV
jgi:MFS family permease